MTGGRLLPAALGLVSVCALVYLGRGIESWGEEGAERHQELLQLQRLHLLTAHERELFRAQQLAGASNAGRRDRVMHVKGGQQLAGVPGWGMNPNSKPMSGSAIHKVRTARSHELLHLATITPPSSPPPRQADAERGFQHLHEPS